MDKHIVFIIDEFPLLEVIRKYGKGALSKDYEYAVSIYMKRFLEERENTQYCIVFEVKPGKYDISQNLHPSPEETIEILRKMLEEDTPVDFGLVKGTISNHEPYAFGFQVKRFRGESVSNFNSELLSYIHEIVGKYKPGETSLIIVPELLNTVENKNKQGVVDTEFLRNHIKVPSDSFLGVFLLLFDKKAIVRQLWPPLV